MKFGLDISTAGEYSNIFNLIELAILAEKHGWDGFFIWDLIRFQDEKNKEEVPVTDITVALTAIALKTTRIKIGVFVCAVPRRRPWKLAKEIASIDHLSNGRLILGVGMGFYPSDFSNFSEEDDLKIRAEKMDESLGIIEKIWSGKQFSHSGKYFTIKNAQFLPKPLQVPRVPIWTAGRNTKGFARAAKYDGIYPMIDKNVDDFIKMRDYIKRIRGDLNSFELSVSGHLLKEDSDPTEFLADMEREGLNWWVELSKDNLDGQIEMIKKGPPK